MPMSKQTPYEEGSWTPVVSGVSVAGTNTYSRQFGWYVRSGNKITAWFLVTLSAKDAAGSGTVSIKGLPYQSTSVSLYAVSIGTLLTLNVTFPTGCTQVVSAVPSSSSVVLCNASGSGQPVTPIDFATGLTDTSSLRGCVTYWI